MKARRKRRRSSGDAWKTVLGSLLLLLAVGAGGVYAYFWVNAPRIVISRETLCPQSGPRGIATILIDTSDELPEILKIQLERRLMETALDSGPGTLIEVRTLISQPPYTKTHFKKCNPGSGSDLSELTANLERVARRWRDEFQNPLKLAIQQSLVSQTAPSSPIMQAIQRISIENFLGKELEKLPKKLIISSDMIEHTNSYSQYSGDLAFDRYRKASAYRTYQTDLTGVEILVFYIRSRAIRDSNSHVNFWAQWFKDNHGKVKSFNAIQGQL
jgi:hypothetical protein